MLAGKNTTIIKHPYYSFLFQQIKAGSLSHQSSWLQYCVICNQSTYLAIVTYAFHPPKLSKQLKAFRLMSIQYFCIGLQSDVARKYHEPVSKISEPTSSIVGWGFLSTSIGLPTTTCIGLGKGKGVLHSNVRGHVKFANSKITISESNQKCTY